MFGTAYFTQLHFLHRKVIIRGRHIRYTALPGSDAALMFGGRNAYGHMSPMYTNWPYGEEDLPMPTMDRV